MTAPQRYNVRWDCPHCGNSHNWWWEDEFEAHDDGECDMICDRCMEPSKCVGDGTGFYKVIEYEEPKPPIEQRVSDLESLEDDLHNYVRGLEDKVNTNNQLAFDAINTATMRLHELESRVDAIHKQSFDAINRLGKRLLRLEKSVSDYRSELDNLGRRTTQAELAVWRLENGIPAGAKLGLQHVELAKEAERDEYRAPEVGDIHFDDIDPTVMRVYDGRKWVEIRRDDDEDADGDDGPGWGMYGYEHDEENF